MHDTKSEVRAILAGQMASLEKTIQDEQFLKRDQWKPHVVDPFDHIDEPLRSQLLAFNARKTPPLGGKIDYDIDGRLEKTSLVVLIVVAFLNTSSWGGSRGSLTVSAVFFIGFPAAVVAAKGWLWWRTRRGEGPSGRGGPSLADKIRALESAGVKVAKHPEEIPVLLK